MKAEFNIFYFDQPFDSPKRVSETGCPSFIHEENFVAKWEFSIT